MTSREERIHELISKMSLEEKASQLSYESPAISRLGIPAYNWWNECLHGVARAGTATVFPQAIALAATFDDEFVFQVATAISDEARAKYNEAIAHGVRTQYRGLTFWTPNINIFRDPRWGRGQETYGEDPFLTSRMGVAFVKGLQGDNPDYLKIAACAKHYAVHSGPEKFRHSFNAIVSKKDLWETYLPAFKALVDAGVESVMGAYNRTLDEPCCASKFLLKDILRGKWKFRGHVVSDCWAIRDFHEFHKVTSSPEESAALAVNTGCDLNCGCTYHALVSAVEKGLLDESKIDESLARLLTTRFKLGMFDEKAEVKSAADSELSSVSLLPPAKTPWDGLDSSVVNCEKHRLLAREAAAKSIVLLKNDNLLPLDNSPKRMLLIGPGAANLHTLVANYHGMSPNLVSILEGITAKIRDKFGITMDYHQGCMMYDENHNNGWTIGMASAVDIVIAVFGLDNAMEGEEGDTIASDAKGDRTEIELPEWQLSYLKALRDRGKPIVLILTGGSPIAIPEEIADAVLFVWYSGEQGGNAVADILFGDVVPSGKLPITFPVSTRQLPPYEDYAMKGRTYRYMTEEPLWPFGFGLSYTTFRFDHIALSSGSIRAGEQITVSVDISNTGRYDADEVVQIYLAKNDRGELDPRWSLRGFKRLHVIKGNSASVDFTLTSVDFESVSDAGERILIPGAYTIIAADSAPFESAKTNGAPVPLCIDCIVN